MPTDGQQLCECAYCEKVGTIHVRRDPARASEVEGFVALGGKCLPSGRLRALCAACVRGAVAAFARRADRAPGVVA